MYAGHAIHDDGGTEGGVSKREIDGAGKDHRRIPGEGTGEKSMFTIETLLSRIFGKPREQTEVSGSVVMHTIKLGKK